MRSSTLKTWQAKVVGIKWVSRARGRGVAEGHFDTPPDGVGGALKTPWGALSLAYRMPGVSAG